MKNDTILLVEDHEDEVELTIRSFKKYKIFNKVDVVRDGQQALDYIFCEGEFSTREFADYPTVILLDLQLPKISGIDVLKKIRSDDELMDIAFIMITAEAQTDNILGAVKAGANSYIVKPFTAETVSVKIKKVFGG